jgi:pyridoxal phosphate enzyme (YggS family)
MATSGTISGNYKKIRDDLPDSVSIVAAAKTRNASEVREVIAAGVDAIGENYVQETEETRRALGESAESVEWHMIGHLQRNKVKQALELFDMIQSLDSLRLARAIGKRTDVKVSVLVQVNIGEEDSKYGVRPDETADFVREVSQMDSLRVRGLMAMEPYFDDPEKARPYFKRMKELFDSIAAMNIEGCNMNVLSMGMTNSYRVAVEEGANMVRIGTAIFGPRDY